jgi:uroporphyrinogen decarboxylase
MYGQDEVRKPLLVVLGGGIENPPPVWLMRQAGRYLPEYRAIRERAGDFLKLCLTPDLAAEVTLQPIRRFGFDAAILFSDILLVPYSLGQRVWFVEGKGPRLETLVDGGGLARLTPTSGKERLLPVYETVAKVKAMLPPAVALLGFCGAPWTVATYMIAGEGTPDQAPARLFAYRDSQGFAGLMDILVERSAHYLIRQLQAGADAVQIFDTWAGILPDEEFWRWCIEPTQRLIATVRREIPGAKIIGFPRAIGTGILRYLDNVAVDAIGLDWTADLDFARKHVSRRVAIQGNLDPLVLVAGSEALDRSIDRILAAFSDRPFIWNLGHGILPATPIAHVEQMLARVRKQ